MPEPTQPEPPRRTGARLPRGLVAIGVLLLIGAGAVVYGMGQGGKKAAGVCTAATATVARLDPLVHGEIAALNLSRAPEPLDVSFDAGDGSRKSISDFRGQTVLLNLWATWCVPCRKEMPALDRLQAEAGGPAFQVVAVNTDTAKLDRPRQFYSDTGIKALPFYADPSGRIIGSLRETAGVVGLPTSFLVDGNGCILGTMAGPADWASDEARRLIAAARS